MYILVYLLYIHSGKRNIFYSLFVRPNIILLYVHVPHVRTYLQFNLGTGAAISSICVKMWRVLVVWEAGMKRVKIKNVVLFR